jgi:hypothetical protein
VKGCWAPDEQQAVETAHRLWANSGLPGEIAQVLPSPEQFEQASSLVTKEATAESVPCGPDPERHAAEIRKYAEAGYDRLYIAQMGPQQEEFFRFFTEEVRPLL